MTTTGTPIFREERSRPPAALVEEFGAKTVEEFYRMFGMYPKRRATMVQLLPKLQEKEFTVAMTKEERRFMNQ